jgi:hypothetical protein
LQSLTPLLVAIYHMLTRHTTYQDLGDDYYVGYGICSWRRGQYRELSKGLDRQRLFEQFEKTGGNVRSAFETAITPTQNLGIAQPVGEFGDYMDRFGSAIDILARVV